MDDRKQFHPWVNQRRLSPTLAKVKPQPEVADDAAMAFGLGVIVGATIMAGVAAILALLVFRG